ncbi:hypothetical protein AKUA2003_02190 [Apilactobacillus kunkeei]|nr:hypothetical protein AKUA2003_02190 [Apilactobacillus kunkeei]CAI2563891.1 hypothetical protein AKUA1001_02210 [Apilactobacillus kunkeei]CAI2801284.1 hypothetical protein AKUA2002_02190 [Apilactobacillus kunkeei]
MQYNKNQFMKSNDKKIMKKVKKQWVVVSIATLAFLGAAAYTATSTPVSAHADTVAAASQSSQQTINTTYSGDISTSNNTDDSASYQSQITQGQSDAYNKRGDQSGSLSGEAANYYKAAYDGAQAAMNAYNNNTQGVGAGTQDYNYYGNTVTKQDGFQNDSKNAQTGTQGSNNKRKTAGDNASDKAASANNTSSTTDTQPNPTDGTPLNSTNTNDTNQGGADNPQDASNSVAKYESTMLNKLNTANNLSVKATSANQSINIPTANTDVIVNEKNKYANTPGLSKAFSSGVTYALTQQGMADAESGKWQGVYAGSNGATQDYYLNSAKNDTTNVYDQAYRGARNAMNAFFSSGNTYNGSASVSASSTGNTAYDAGFNDVVNQASQGIVYVQNGQQYQNIMTGSTASGTVGGNVAKDNNGNTFTTVRIANDIDLTGATNGENDGTIYTNQATLTVDGQNHMMDFHGNNYTVNRPGTGSLDVYLQNFQTMYGANFFGTFRAEPGAVFHFSNVNYVGPQLLSSYSNDTYFSGNVNVLVPTASPNYTSPFQSNVNIEGNGNQENLEVNNFILEPNSTYFGNTSTNYGGTNVVVTGNFTLGENSKMTLIPRGGNGGAATIADGSTWGIWLRNSGASLNINKNATLNIIPALLTSGNYKNLFGGAVYSGTQVSININGGTLNYEGYKGISGYYNQPIDLQGSSSTQINVINGGIMQVLMDSIPDTTAWNSYNGHQSTYDGLINNVGLGSFNVGSRGNLKVGVTNSDSTYNVPYYGPININSVGSNHAIFLKPSAVQQFQTTTGTSGTGKAGNINAFSVAITQADGTKQYLYNFTLNSGSTTYTGVDFNGNQVSGKIAGNTLDISDVPAVQFVGPLTKQTNGDGTTTVTAYAKLSNYQELNNQPIYVGVASSNSNGSYNQLTQMPNSNIVDAYSKADPNTYTTTIDTTGYSGGIIPITYTIPSGTPSTYVGMRLHYGINSVNSVLGPQAATTTVEGYQAGSNGKVVETASGDMQVGNTQLSNVQSGINDGLADSVSGTTANKDAESFNTKTNSDYLANYNSIQAGYKAFDPSNPNQDYTQLDSYINSSSPSAFAQGYREAAYQAGLSDARFNQTKVQGNANYSEAQTQYNQAYQAALSAGAGQTAQQIIKNNNLPTLTSNGTAATAVTTAISDAQGALAFFADEQAATINGSNFTGLNGDKAKIAAYNDAYQGYKNALSVDSGASNPDGNADKAESAGFDYGQSLINGGLASTRPTATASHMNNLNAAQLGYDAAQAAITKAKANSTSSSDSKATSHDGVSTDNFKGDLTAYKSIKFGAYTGLNNQSDSNLNSLEKVGYAAVVSKAAYNLGVQAFNSNSGSTPTGVAAQSDTGKKAFAQGYNDAQTSFNQGKSDGLTAVQSNPNTSDVPSSVPSTVANADAYKTGYKGSVDGYSDGSSTSAGTQTKKDNTQQASYSNAYDPAYSAGRQVAGSNDYVQYKQPKATDSDYTTGYNQAEQGHTDGYNDAKNNPGTTPTPTKSTSIAYVNGYNSGVSDEQADATKAANDQGYIDGTNDFLNNVVRPQTTSQIGGKSTQYTTNYFKAYDAAEAGFKDKLAGQNNASQYESDDKAANAYAAGQGSAQTSMNTLNSAETNASNATISSSDSAVDKATKDVFNTSYNQLEKQSYQPVSNTNGNLYKDISAYYSPLASQKYNAGLAKVQQNSSAQGANSIEQLAIDQYNAGHSDGYQAAKTSDNPTPTKSSADSYVQGFSKGVSDEKADAADAANAQAYVDGQNDFLNNVTRPQTVSQLSGKSTTATTNYFNSYDAAEAGFKDGFAQSAKNTSKYSDSNLQSAYNAAYDAAVSKARAQLTKDEQNVDNANTPASSDASADKSITAANEVFKANYDSLKGLNHAADSNINTQGNLYKDINDVYSKEAGQKYSNGLNAVQQDNNATGANTIEQLAIDQYKAGHADGYQAAKNSSNPQANSTAASYVQGFNQGVSDEQRDASNAADAQAYVDGQNDFLNNVTRPQQTSQLNGKSVNATINYFNSYDAAEAGFKDGITNSANNTNKYMNATLQAAYSAGYNAAVNKARAQLNKDEQDINNANTPASSDTTADKSVTAANEVFKANYDSLKGLNHTADSNINTQGNLYKDINNQYSQEAGQKYNEGIDAVQQDKNAKSSNTIEQLAIDQYNAGHADGYEAAKNSSNPQANSTAASYVKGFSKGVSDEQTDAANAANSQAFVDGQNDFVNNVTRPQTVSQLSGKSTTATTNYFNSYDAAEAGFKDALNQTAKNTTKYTDTDLQNAYNTGYDTAVNKVQSQLTKDEQDVNNANTPAPSDATADKSVTAANEVFKANYDNLKDVAHTADSNVNTNGNLYNDINTVYSQSAGNKYNAGLAAVQQNKNATSSNTIEQLAIDQYNAGHTDGYEAAKTSDNPTPTKSGATSYTQGFHQGVSDEKAAQQGFKADVLKAEQQTDPDHPTTDGQSDAFKGAAAALKNVYDNGGNQPHITNSAGYSDDYVNAYNQEIDKANAANAQAKNDMTNGVAKNSDNINADSKNNATKAIYNHAYDQVATGFGAGLNSTNGTNYPSNADQQYGYNTATGYETGKSLAAGYQAAMSDFLAGKTDPSANTAPGYADTMKALVAAQNGAANPSTSALGKYAYSQQLATKNAINDSINGNAKGNVPDGVDPDVYNEAYKAAKDGFDDGSTSGNVQSTNKDNTDTSLAYTDSYAQALKAARAQQGAKDYVNGTINSNSQSTDPSYAAGITSATNGFNDGKAGQDNTATASNPSAYAIGLAAGQSAKRGIDEAKNATDPSKLTGDAKNAYYGVKDAYATVASSTKPSSQVQGVQTGSQAYTSAYNDALTTAQAKANDGANAFAGQTAPASKLNSDGRYKPSNDDNDKAYASGYNQALAGYNAAKSGNIDPNNTNSSYQAGVGLAKDLQTGINIAKTNSGQASDPAQQAAIDAVKQAYADAKNGVDNPTNVPSNDAAYAKIYQDAYNQVKQDAKNDINNGVQNYLSGGNKSGNSDIDSQQSDAAFDKAAQGYSDGSAAGATNQHPNDVAYTKGFDAAKSVQQAIADKQNNTNNSSDSSKNPDTAAYNNAAQGYTDGLAAVTSSTTPAQTGVEYTTAYNQALKDGQTAYNTGVNNALSSLSGSENDGNPIGSYGTNSPLGGVAKQGFDDVKAGFDNEIQNALGNNPTPISNPNAANTEGTKLAQSVENAITTALASADNINAPKISGINNDGLTNDINGAIAEAYKNYRDASATDKNGKFTAPTSFTPAQQLAYNDAIAKLQSEEKANLKAAQQDVMSNNVDNHKDSNVDIYNKAKAMVDGISDANDDNPTNDSKYASDNKDAYDQGKALGVKNRATGAQAYLNGSSEPAGSDALSGAQKAGYDLAKLGFQEATNGTAPSKPNDPNYMAGYKAAQAVKDVERNNANNNKNATYADKASATQAQSGYTDAITAFKNASDPATVNDAVANQSPAYTQAYKDTVDKLKQDYQAGRDQFKNGQLTADTTGIANADEQNAVQQGLADENAGFTTGLTGDTTFKPANGAQSDGQSLGQKVKSEIQAANDSGHTVDTGSKILDDAINKARQAVENDPTVSDTNYPEGLSDLAKQVYMASVDSFKASYQNGVNSVVTSGATKPAPAVNDNSFAQKGASDATAAIDAGFAGTDKPNALADAYQLGQDAKNGYLKAIGQNTTSTTSDAANTGNQAASQAITDQTSTPAGHTSLDDKSEVYKLAYEAVKTNSVVESSKNDGALNFSKGQIEPTATDQVSQITKDAYDAAAKGYADARDGKIDSSRQDDAYKTGIKAYQDAQAGIKLANQQTSAGQGVPATDPNNDNKPLSDSEKLAYQAVMDAYNGVNETNPGNPIYDEAYKQALKDKTSAEQKGATAELTGNDQPVTALQQSIYDNGKDEAKTGYENAQQDMTSSLTNYNTGVNQKDAENGAALAFQDALNGKPQSAPTQASEVFKDAYNKAYAEAQSYIKDGEDAANKKQNPNLSGTSAKNRLTQAAYDQFTNGYNTQMANVDSNAGYPTNNQSPMFSDGVNKAKEVQAAIANYENSGFVNGTDKTDALQTLADQAYQDGINGNTDHKSTNIEPNDAQALEKTDVYRKVQDYATNVVNGAKALFNNDNQDPTKGDSLKINRVKTANDKAFNKGLDQASAALKDAMQNDSSMDAKYDPQTLAGRVYFATKMAYNQVAPNGSSEYNGKVDVVNDATAKAAYDAALANAKKIASQSSQDASNNVDNSANYSGLAKIVYDGTHSLAKGAFSDALKGINADKYTGNDEGSITYQAVQNAINDYLTNDGQAKKDPNKVNISADKADVYTAAYNQALAMVNKAASQGLSMYLAGNSDEQIASSQAPNDSLNKVAVESARRAKAGHDDSINNEGQVSNANKSIADDSSYLAGLKGAKDADKGVEMALADSTQAPDADDSQAEKDGFNGTVDGYHKASTDGSITPEDIDSYISNNLGDKSVAYRDAFKNAYLDGLKVAKKGADAANANQLDSTKGQNGAAQKAQSQGYQDANNAFLDKLHGIDDKDATSNTPASVSGRQRATQYLLALQDVADGHPNTSDQDADYQKGLATAQAALQQAVIDAKANKQLPETMGQIAVPDGLDPVAYRDAYAGILSGFYNGYNSKTTDSGSSDAYYNIAFSLGYAKGKANIPTDTTAPSDFLNNKKMPNITDPAVIKAYNDQYDAAKSGFYDGLYNRGSKSTNAYYKASYKVAQDGLAGMKLAAKGDSAANRAMLKNQSAAFVNGYNGYLKGVAAAKRTLKNNKKLSAKDLLGKDKLYSYTFTQGLKHEVKIQKANGKKAGTKKALERHAIPKDIYTRHSETYARTYVATYKKEMKRHMPRYIYNVGTIFTHNHVKFTRHTRIRKYAYSARYNSTVFRVVGVKYYKNRIPRYRLSNGAVVTASPAVQNAYYKKHFKKYRVIKPTGVLIHTGKTFTKRNSVRRLYRGEVFHVRKVVKFHGITRLYVGKSAYITSNKTFVKAIIK